MTRETLNASSGRYQLPCAETGAFESVYSMDGYIAPIAELCVVADPGSPCPSTLAANNPASARHTRRVSVTAL
jgi:hypothetical protein